ncbi:succinate dehydrogenase assembly factor 1, mitochondrial isoform X1 [Salmo salar]|uniref:LYR motif-containing protein ENSP00000368165 n=2 Tax=Salmoninae TaxID=504568 RepID=B5XC43_SALSA|nr:succinate dehydrogenase assembly factor 1, mitochondrial isoform X1 [Salmo salar]ACI68413.1 LYR motif-containing protein ENSP00000368165 [Salmo salar]|eukprot:XP_014052071.1 PREDICTED: succinate dehydrogenase assembly factor 1, mitochondrial isoform X1 [Salmo salar]
MGCDGEAASFSILWSVLFPGHLCCWCPVFHTMVRHSKLQKQVLSLYRQFLRAGQDKPGFLPRIRDEFRENSHIKKTDVMHIEYLYRRGQRQLDQLKDVNTKQLGTFSKPKAER